MAVQRVRRVVRKIDPWTVLKVSLVFNAMMALAFVLGTVIFWTIFVNAGIPERINELALLIGLENGINLDGQVYFRIVVLLSVIGTIMMTGFFTLGAVVYNLISDLVGGVEFIVLEETSGPQGTRPKVSLPVASERTTPRRTILPPVKPAVRTERRPDEAEEERETATADLPRTG
ncbi:MAG: DUF3566 domain-containing protein [Acidimicrobiia bacterium]